MTATPKRPHGPAPRRVVALCAVLVVAACGPSGSSDARREVVVHAAASLSDAFADVEAAIEADHPELDLRLNLAGSQALATQIAQGAPGAVFASANREQVTAVADLVDGQVTAFATNELVLVTPTDNPAHIDDLADLAAPVAAGTTGHTGTTGAATTADATPANQPDVEQPGAPVVVLANEQVPAGAYARQVLDNAGLEVAPSSLELDVRAVLSKVELGEADAGVVYATDAAGSDDVTVVAIPAAVNVSATHHVAALTQQATDGRVVVDWLLSPAGQSLLAEHGFGAP